MSLFLLITGCGRYGGLAPLVSFPKLFKEGRPLSKKKTTGQYRIQKGDTLYSLAKRQGIPLQDLIAHNRLDPPYALKVGQLLSFPKAQTHVVQKGDTLYSLSRLYHMDQYTLSQLNNLQYPYVLSVGQQLTISQARLEQKSEGTFLKKKPIKQKRTPKAAVSTLPSRQGSFLKPLHGRILSRYGVKKNGVVNDGINIEASQGAPVKATENGVVVYTGQSIKSFGNLVLIKHKDGWVSAYGHLKEIRVKEGTSVKQGALLGTVGKTGYVDKPQLHFELRKGSKTFDPMGYLF